MPHEFREDEKVLAWTGSKFQPCKIIMVLPFGNKYKCLPDEGEAKTYSEEHLKRPGSLTGGSRRRRRGKKSRRRYTRRR